MPPPTTSVSNGGPSRKRARTLVPGHCARSASKLPESSAPSGIEMIDHRLQRVHAAFTFLRGQVRSVILADSVLVGDRAALAHDRLADCALQRAPACQRLVSKSGTDSEHEGRIDARSLRIDVREMGLGVASLAEAWPTRRVLLLPLRASWRTRAASRPPSPSCRQRSLPTRVRCADRRS